MQTLLHRFNVTSTAVLLVLLSLPCFSRAAEPMFLTPALQKTLHVIPLPIGPQGNSCQAFNSDGEILCCTVSCAYDKSAICINGDWITTCTNASCECK